MYSLDFSKNAFNYVGKLPKEEHEQLFKKLNSIREYPFRFLKKLQGDKFWRLRMGKHRAIIDVIVINKKIFVVRIGKRDSVYKS